MFKKLISSLLAIVMVCGILAGCSSTSTLEIINEASASERADTVDDEELISMFNDKLYYNAMLIMGWINAGVGLERDETDIFSPVNTDTTRYVWVKNIQNIKLLKANCELIFSKEFLKTTMYPLLIEGETPLFVENNDKLYYNSNTGGGSAYAPDIARARVINKSKEMFEIEAPITTVDDQIGKPFVYKVVKQDGNWVLDEFYF